MEFAATDFPHRRFNPLTGDWVLISPHRMERPWHGLVEKHEEQRLPPYDSHCYLCPGNQRAGGTRNDLYNSTYVFTNDFAALLPETPRRKATEPLLRFQSAQGTCRVICFSPRHDLTLARMPVEEIRLVVDLWAEQTLDLGHTYRWVQVFENRGAMMGASNPHPHGQVWATQFLPDLPCKEDAHQKAYLAEHGRPLLVDYAALESRQAERIVVENSDWLAVVPYWATWPFETILLPRRHVCRIPELTGTERDSLATILKTLLVKYDNLFATSFPYSMGWHGAPLDTPEYPYWQLHAHFYPPLLRSATIRKFMVGFEMLAEPQRDLTAEAAAERLRVLPVTRFSETTADVRDS
jgi:UDPglucose--hexose-1-phosphate uridylyltransferase